MRAEASRKGQRERLRVIARIDDRHLVLESSQVLPRVALDSVQLLSVRMAAKIEPEFVVEPNRIHDQGIAVPVRDRVPVPGGIRIGGMLSAQEDLPVAVNIALEKEVNVRR